MTFIATQTRKASKSRGKCSRSLSLPAWGSLTQGLCRVVSTSVLASQANNLAGASVPVLSSFPIGLASRVLPRHADRGQRTRNVLRVHVARPRLFSGSVPPSAAATGGCSCAVSTSRARPISFSRTSHIGQHAFQNVADVSDCHSISGPFAAGFVVMGNMTRRSRNDVPEVRAREARHD